jgi:hypothetical protein
MTVMFGILDSTAPRQMARLRKHAGTCMRGDEEPGEVNISVKKWPEVSRLYRIQDK